MKTKFFLLLIVLPISVSAFSQKKLLQSGPMVGYSEMREVMLWVQTRSEAKVQIRYTNMAEKSESRLTNAVITRKDKAFTAKLLADSVEPGNRYEYDLYINEQKVKLPYKTEFQSLPLWKWRSDAPDFSFITGSGTYINESRYDRPGKPYGGDYRIFESMAKSDADFVIWLGDNTYLREPDWNSKTGMIKRYTHTRSNREMQALLASKHHYAVWDDHDYGPNNSDKSYPFKNEALEVFELFWANPIYGIGDIKGAVSYFNWNDCDFFLLDNRWYRSPNNLKAEDKTMLGKAQLEWLKNALVSSNAAFKFVVMGGQFLNTSGLFEVYSNYGFAGERTEIIDFILKQDIRNVVFLTGDRHHSEVSVLKSVGKPTIHDITSSPLTSGAAGIWEDEVNALRVEGSLFNVRNYVKFNLSGAGENRKIDVVFYDTDGKELYRYEIKKETNK